jgi:hypothetical protein
MSQVQRLCTASVFEVWVRMIRRSRSPVVLLASTWLIRRTVRIFSTCFHIAGAADLESTGGRALMKHQYSRRNLHCLRKARAALRTPRSASTMLQADYLIWKTSRSLARHHFVFDSSDTNRQDGPCTGFLHTSVRWESDVELLLGVRTQLYKLPQRVYINSLPLREIPSKRLRIQAESDASKAAHPNRPVSFGRKDNRFDNHGVH